MEKDFWTKKSFISHINRECFFGDTIYSIVRFEPFCSIRIIFNELT